MLNTAKQEAIRKAYGDLYERYKNRISQYSGWLELDNLFMSREDYDLRDNEVLEFKNERGNYCFRPKSLQGIENNNGWTVADVSNLPTEGVFNVGKFLNDGSFHQGYDDVEWYDLREYIVDFGFTHFQHIVKPEKPIY